MSPIVAKFVDSVASISAITWNQMVRSDYPFIKHEFLLALEESAAVGEGTGWLPHHLILYRSEKIVAALPCYLKEHSFGEYVFDQSWANAYYANGLEYYPKLTSAIPFTPITGPRLIYRDGENVEELYALINEYLSEECRNKGYSSWHLLFAHEEAQGYLQEIALERKAVHFKWKNRDYGSFDDFLSSFSSRKRKNLKKEREYLRQQSIEFELLVGKEIRIEHWQYFYRFYQMTYAKKSGHSGYLPKSFFIGLACLMPENVVLVFAKKGDRYIAAALNFKDSNALYGRYWGCIEEYKYLHFETCYYQGIEYAIENKLSYFDPGVQGEHKIQRGFEPDYTYSYHWLAHEGFREAVVRFLNEESDYVVRYRDDARNYLPYKSKQTDAGK